MTYYKYAERDEASRVDWGTISKTWSDTIQKGLNERETKRGAIQTATELLTQEIIAQPEGTHRGVQEFYSDYSVNAQDILLEANRRLKSGDIKVRDYMALMANMTTDVATITGLGQYYMDNHKEISDRWANGESQEFEVKLGEVFQDHTNFTDTDVAFDPVTGKARIVKRVLNPETGLFESGSILTPAELRSAMGTRYDRYDADGAATKIASELGKTQTAILEGKIKTIEGQSEKDYIDKILDQQVEAAMTDGLHVSSVLTMDMDGYAVTFDAKEALDSPDSVLGVLNPLQPNAGEKVPLVGVIDQIEDLEGAKKEQLLDQIFGADLSKEDREELIRRAREQRDIAKGWMTEEARARFNDIETARQEFNTNTSGRGPSATDKAKSRQGKENLGALRKIYEGNDTGVQEGLDHVFGRDPSYRSGDVVSRDGKRFVVLNYYDSKEKKNFTREIEIGNNLPGWVDKGSSEFYKTEEAPYIYEAFEGLSADEKAVAPGTGVGHAERVEPILSLDEATVGETPASQYFVDMQGESGTDGNKTAAAARASLGATGVDASQIAVFTNDVTESIHNESNWRDNNDVIRFYVPGVTETEVFIPHNEEGRARLLELMALIPSFEPGETLSLQRMTELLSSIPEFTKYNSGAKGKKMRDALGINEGEIPNPNEPAEEDQSTSTTPDYENL